MGRHSLSPADGTPIVLKDCFRNSHDDIPFDDNDDVDYYQTRVVEGLLFVRLCRRIHLRRLGDSARPHLEDGMVPRTLSQARLYRNLRRHCLLLFEHRQAVDGPPSVVEHH